MQRILSTGGIFFGHGLHELCELHGLVNWPGAILLK